VLLNQVLDCRIFLVLDPLDGGTPLSDLLLTQHLHLVLISQMDLVADALELVTGLRLLTVLLSGESVEVFLVTDLLLFLGDVDRSQVLFKFALIDAVLVLDVLERDLRFFLQLRELIKVLED
jgi:hypothetical protein